MQLTTRNNPDVNSQGQIDEDGEYDGGAPPGPEPAGDYHEGGYSNEEGI